MYPTHNLQTDPGQCILLIIDPQNDFHEGGSLAVPGSTAQAKRIAAMISEHKDKIGEIFVTLDSHHKKHIAHQAFWSSIENDVANKGDEPAADCSVEITEDDLLAGKWFPKDCSLQHYCLKYTRQLELKGKFTLRIWPDHCLIGSDGHAIQDDIQRALREWDIFHYHKSVKYIHKGMNCLTEMYSAIQAEVPLPSDPTTTRNEELLNAFVDCGRLIVCGQALSHCVKCTVEDIAEHWENQGGDRADLSRLYVLEDGSAAVPGCEASAKEFIADMRTRGATVTTIAHAFDGWASPAGAVGEDAAGPAVAVESSPLKAGLSSRNLSNALHLLECGAIDAD